VHCTKIESASIILRKIKELPKWANRPLLHFMLWEKYATFVFQNMKMLALHTAGFYALYASSH